MIRQPNFFKSINLPYYIFAPDFTQKSAGIRALHYLCHALNEMGREAYLVGTDIESDKLRTPLLHSSDIIRHVKSGLIPIMVYPEVVLDNPFEMPFVVRWWLNKPGYLGGDQNFASDDLLFTYAKAYVPEGLEAELLNIPLVNNAIFHNDNNPHNGQRRGACYYANKYLLKGGQLTEHVEGAVSLGQNRALSHHDIADILRRSEVLYCYEPTALIGEALLCGCPVVMIDTDYLRDNMTQPIHGPGISYSSTPDALAEARAGINEVRYNNQQSMNYCWWQLGQFIRKTSNAFEQRLSELNWSDMEWVMRLTKQISSREPSSASQSLLKQLNVSHHMWLQHQSISEPRVMQMVKRLTNEWKQHSSFHFVMVVNASELEALSRTLSSLQTQLYSGWGMSIFCPVEQPEAFVHGPENIEWLQVEGDFGGAIDQAVQESGLDWVMQLWPGDTLTDDALLTFVETINLYPDKHFIYSDEVTNEAKAEIAFKPDFNLDYLHSFSYIGRAFMVRRDSFEMSGGYTAFAYVYASDLAFKVYETYGESAFSHIPQVLYYAAPIQLDQDLLLANEITIRQGHFLRRELPVHLTHPAGNPRFQVRYLSQEEYPPVTVVIAQRNQPNSLVKCVESLIKGTDYPNIEVLIVDAASDIEDMPYVYDELTSQASNQIKIVYSEHQNYAAAVNEGITQSAHERVVVMSPFTMTPNANWLKQLLSLSAHPQMGLVGCRVIDENKSIIHAGTVLGVGDDFNGQFQNNEVAEPGYMERAHCVQQYSSVSSACYLGLKSHLLKVGGLDDGLADTKYAVVDLALKLQQQGLKVLWTPFSTVVQDIALASSNNGVSDYQPEKTSDILSRWPEPFKHDPMFNPQLSLRSSQFLVENQIVFDGDARFRDCPRVLVFPLNESGTGRYRCIDPLHQLERQGQLEAIWLPSHELKTEPFLPNHYEIHRLQADVVFIQQALSDKHFAYFKQLKELSGLPFIFSLDDLLTSLPDQSNRKSLVFRDMRHRLRRTLALCERLIVSTQPLADFYAEFIDDIEVIPNALDIASWPINSSHAEHSARKLRVGWAGATQHSGDLALIEEVVKALAGEVTWVFMGMCPESLEAFVDEVHPYVSYAEYPSALAELDLDLALAPLEDNPFNRCKSNLRLLEYGIQGWPVIASKVYPYMQNQPPITLVENEVDAWVAAIKAAIAEPHKFAAQGKSLKNWVDQNYSLKDQLTHWMQTISL
jgi:glycosyltransferase involved in cell wall biosynthesis/GT2 family glycosyltransferase